jgi:hypothetical protein
LSIGLLIAGVAPARADESPRFALNGVSFAPATNATAAPSVPQLGGGNIRLVAFGGLAFAGGGIYGGAGFGAGAGVLVGQFLDREEFGLQIDAMYSNYGDFGCDFCNTTASAFSVSGAFLYNFNRMDNGWQPYVGGGLVVHRFNWKVEIEILATQSAAAPTVEGDFENGEVFIDLGYSGTHVGLQIQGGMRKMKDNGGFWGFEGRIQSVIGGAFVLLGTIGF